MPVLSQVRSKCIKHNFNIKISLHLGCSPPPLPDVSCTPGGGLCVPVSDEVVLPIPCDVSSVISISCFLLFKDQFPACKALLEVPDTCPSHISAFVKRENLILIFC